MSCSNCGKKIFNDSHFYSHCGNPVMDASEISRLVRDRNFEELAKLHRKGKGVVPIIIELIDYYTNFMNCEFTDETGYCANAIGYIGLEDPVGVKDAMPGLIKMLNDKDSLVRIRATEAIAQIGMKDPGIVKDAVPKLLNLLHDKDDNVLLVAINSICYIGLRDPALVRNAIAKLIKLFGDKNSDVKILSISSVGLIGMKDPVVVKDAIPRLTKMLDDKANYIRGRSVLAISLIGRTDPPAIKDAIPKLTKMLVDKDNVIRSQTAQALGKIGTTQTNDSLSNLLNDYAKQYKYESTVGEIARDAIENIKKNRAWDDTLLGNSL